MEQSKHSQGVTSVKVHHKPGGASNFSLGWGEESDMPKRSGVKKERLDPSKMEAAGVARGKETKEEDQKHEEEESKGEAPASTPAAVPVSQPAAAKPEPVNEGGKARDVQTSVRVHAPPGGKSSITF